MIKTLFILIFVLLLSLLVMGQTIDKPSLIGARDAALGDADISGAYNISSMYENPASVVFLSGSSIAFNHSQIKNNLGMGENLAFPVLHNGAQLLALGFNVFHLGYLQPVGNYAGQHIMEFGYHMTFASSLTPTFSLGISGDFMQGRTNSSLQWASFYSLGIDYSPTEDISYGAIFSGLGSTILYSIQDTAISANTINAPKILEVGATMSYPSSASLRRKFLFISFANEKIFNEKGLFYKAGLEVIPIKIISLSLGFVSGPNISEPRYGLGIHFDGFNLQYVIYPQKASYMQEQIAFWYDNL